MIVLPGGKYQNTQLPMGIIGSLDIFPEKMSQLTNDLEHVRMYIDKPLVISKGSFVNHLEKVETILICLQKVELKMNITKSTFSSQQQEYLGYWLTPKGIQPLASKVKAIINSRPVMTLQQVCSILGMVN